MLIAPKQLKLQTSNLTCMFPVTVLTWPHIFLEKRASVKTWRGYVNFCLNYVMFVCFVVVVTEQWLYWCGFSCSSSQASTGLNTSTCFIVEQTIHFTVIFIPPLVGGRGFVFARFLSLFLCLFLCQQRYEKTAGPICMKFSGKVWSDHGTTWLNFESIRVNGSAGRRSSCLLSPVIAQSQLHSLGCGRGLALTSQLHRWQQGAGFVVPRTTACFSLSLTSKTVFSLAAIQKLKLCIALHGKPISELRDVTCHMGSHSVTCHPTQVNTPRLNHSQ